MIVFCWGDDNADSGIIKYLKELGLHGIIYDKVDRYSTKEVKESIFLIEARESQKNLLKLVAESAQQTSAIGKEQALKEKIFDVDRARENFDQMSTCTTLDSLESMPSIVK